MRPASASSGTTEAIAQGFAGSALRSTLGPSSNPFGMVAQRVDIEARTMPSTPTVPHSVESVSFSSSRSPSVSAMRSRWSRLTRRVERAPDQVPGEGRRGHGVRYEPDRLGRSGTQAPRDHVGAVTSLSHSLQDPILGPAADIRISSPRPVRTNEAVVWETPARRATSASVTRRGKAVLGHHSRALVGTLGRPSWHGHARDCPRLGRNARRGAYRHAAQERRPWRDGRARRRFSGRHLMRGG